MQEISQILQKLISFKTLSADTASCREALEYVESLFAGLEVEVSYVEQNGIVSQIILPKGTDMGSLDVLLNGHVDIASAEDAQFSPKEEDGRIYGRGAADMKGSIVAMALAFREFLVSGSKETSVGMLITSDEEVGGVNGCGHVLSQGKLRPSFVIVGDGARFGNFGITTKEKGGVWIELKAEGKSAHASRPWLGENALDKVLQAVEKVREYMGTMEPDAWKSTFNLAKVETSNTMPNVVPADARAVVDLRFTETVAGSPKELAEKIQALVPEVQVSALTDVPIAHVDEQDTRVQLFKKTADEIWGQEIPFVFGHGASDARYFADKDIPAIVVGSVGGNWHSDGEWADLKSLELLKETVLKFLKTLA